MVQAVPSRSPDAAGRPAEAADPQAAAAQEAAARGTAAQAAAAQATAAQASGQGAAAQAAAAQAAAAQPAAAQGAAAQGASEPVSGPGGAPLEAADAVVPGKGGPAALAPDAGTIAAPAAAPATHGPLLVVILGLITAIGPLSLDMYLPAFPAIADDLGVSDAQVQLSLTTCLIGLALGQLVCGPLSDRWGRRWPAILGVGAYAVISLLIALSPSAPVLIVLRLLQGLAGGVGVVVARAVVRDLYSGVAAAKFFSRLTLIFGVGPIAAPGLGSVVLGVTSWHGIFVALGIIAVLLTLLIAWRLPETLPAGRRSPGGLGDVGRTARTIFTDRVFLGYALAQSFAFAAMFSYIAGSSFVLQDGYGMSPGVFSLLFGVNACGLIALSQANGWLLDRSGPRRLLVVILVVEVAAGAAVLLSAALGLLIALAVGFFVLVSTVGMVMPNATALALDRHPERAGTAAALLGGIQSVIAALAAPLVGALGEPGRGVPMAIVMVGSAVLALLVTLTLTHERR
jgi:DHA1 family bicyclomycin/chloramphenicol resistance-like MFS transporter